MLLTDRSKQGIGDKGAGKGMKHSRISSKSVLFLQQPVSDGWSSSSSSASSIHVLLSSSSSDPRLLFLFLDVSSLLCSLLGLFSSWNEDSALCLPGDTFNTELEIRGPFNFIPLTGVEICFLQGLTGISRGESLTCKGVDTCRLSAAPA